MSIFSFVCLLCSYSSYIRSTIEIRSYNIMKWIELTMLTSFFSNGVKAI